jgi:hypothetical protein
VRIVFESIHNARNAVLDEDHVKVDEQAKAFVRQAEIRQKLFPVDRSERLDGFDFDDYLVFHDEIGPEASIYTDTLIDHRNRLLSHGAETSTAEFIRQDGIINGFQQARAEGRVNAEGGVHNLPGDGVLCHKQALFVSRQGAKPPRTQNLSVADTFTE